MNRAKMKQKKHRLASTFLAFVILFTLGLASFAPADAAGSGVADALTPAGTWEQLSAGQSRWYAFDYAGDRSQIVVRLEVVPEGSIGFVVWTPEEIYRWGLGERVEPIGRGSSDANAGGSLVWSGNFTTAGAYYVVVEGAANSGETGYYSLDVGGDGVSFSASAPTSTPDSTPPAKTVVSQPRSALASQITGRLVFQTTYGGPLYTINADGADSSGSLQRLTNGIDPVWSPNGEQIAFVRWEEPRGVWLVNADGSNAHRVFDWSEARFPSWSPDGQEIVFSRQKSGGGGGGFPGVSGNVATFAGRPPEGPPPGGSSDSGATLGIVNVGDGTFREPLPVSTTSLTPDWSPDGTQIVFAGNNGLMVQSVDGQGSWQLTTNPYDTTPAWSPDGTKVAFVRRQHDHWEIYVIDVTTGQQTRLTDTPDLNGVAASSVSPAWSPDGKYIAFLTDRAASTTAGGEWEIWVMKANGSSQGPLFGAELDGLTLEYAFAGERAIDWTW